MKRESSKHEKMEKNISKGAMRHLAEDMKESKRGIRRDKELKKKLKRI